MSTLELPPRVVGEIEASRAGPTLVVLGALHGNEPAGVEAGRRVLDALGRDESLARGRLVVVMGNRRAWAEGQQRYLEKDLNRMWTGGGVESARALRAEQRSPEMTEMLEIADLLERERARGPMLLVDIHTVSSKSQAFAAVEDSLAGRRLARSLGLPIVLGFEEELVGLLIDHFSRSCDGVGVVVEAGQHEDPVAATVAEAVIWRAMRTAGMVADEPAVCAVLAGRGKKLWGRVFDVRHRHEIRASDFEIIESVHAFDRARVGQTIAFESGAAVVSPEPGLVFMPNRQKSKRPGDDGYFIVRPVSGFWLWLSARLRRRRLIHWALPRLVPGVRARPGHPGQLLVSPRIAAVMKRELFHLLGYRLVRHTGERHLSPLRRVVIGAVALLGALGTMLAGVFRGGERAVLAREEPEDWVVARRHLDVVAGVREKSR